MTAKFGQFNFGKTKTNKRPPSRATTTTTEKKPGTKNEFMHMSSFIRMRDSKPIETKEMMTDAQTHTHTKIHAPKKNALSYNQSFNVLTNLFIK